MANDPVVTQGLIGTGNRIADVHPGDWRRKVFVEKLGPGNSPFMNMLLKLPTAPTKSKDIHWFLKPYNLMSGDVLDVKTDAGLQSPYTTGAVKGTPLYITLKAADAQQFVEGDTIVIIDTATMAFRNFYVANVKISDDTASYLAVRMISTTDTANALASATLTWIRGGNVRPEGSPLPKAIFEDLVPQDNQTSIFMESAEMTGTEQSEDERVDPPASKRVKTDAFDRFLRNMETTYLFSEKDTIVSPINNQKQRFMRGLIPAIRDYDANNIMNYTTDVNYTGKTWYAGGWDWLKNLMVDVARKSQNSTMQLYLGDLAWLGIGNLVEDFGLYKIDETTNQFGFRVKRLVGLSVTLELVLFPKFCQISAFRRSALLTDMNLLERVVLKDRDISYVRPQDVDVDGFVWVDGTKLGWYCEQSLRYDNLGAMRLMHGIGSDNTLT